MAVFHCKHADNCPLVKTQQAEIDRLNDRLAWLVRELRSAHENIGRNSVSLGALRKEIDALKAGGG